MSETHVAPKPPVDRNAAATSAAVSAPAPVRKPNRRLQAVGNTLTVLGIMLLTFTLTVTVIGSLQFNRDQKTMYATFRGELANATAPVSQVDYNGSLVAIGAPVALLSFPAQKKQFVVVEGTTANALMTGPGHRRDTVLPGQAGVSIIFGRRAMFNGPFSVLLDLKAGDKIIATTGQGRAVYRVTKTRVAGTKAVPSTAVGQMTLMTAAGKPYVPNGVYYVDADLVTTANPGNNSYVNYSTLFPSERAMQGEKGNWVAILLLAEGLLLATIAIVWLYFRQGRLIAWVIGLPLVLALGIALSIQISGLLPNLM